MNGNERRTVSEQIAVLLAVMKSGVEYTADDLAMMLGVSVSGTRVLIRAAANTGLVWQHRGMYGGPLLYMRIVRRCESAGRRNRMEGEIHGYDREWQTFRDLCMLAHAR